MPLPDIIDTVLDHGVEVTLGKDIHGVFYNMNTGCKSELKLYHNGDSFLARMRYNEVEEIDDFYALCSAVKHCMHGRDFINTRWAEILCSLGILS